MSKVQQKTARSRAKVATKKTTKPAEQPIPYTPSAHAADSTVGRVRTAIDRLVASGERSPEAIRKALTSVGIDPDATGAPKREPAISKALIAELARAMNTDFVVHDAERPRFAAMALFDLATTFAELSSSESTLESAGLYTLAKFARVAGVLDDAMDEKSKEAAHVG